MLSAEVRNYDLVSYYTYVCPYSSHPLLRALLEKSSFAKICKNLFQLLLGDRYGYQPFPGCIEKEEFELLKESAEKMSLNDLHLLDEWFTVDRNAVPVSYVLTVSGCEILV
jgi:hypothetical protein